MPRKRIHPERNYGKYLGDAVYGALDGTVTTFAIISGAVGAGLPQRYVIILGMANLFADGFSMAVGSYMSQKSHLQYLNKKRLAIEDKINHQKEVAIQELKNIYQDKGFDGFNLTQAINIISAQPRIWAQELLDSKGLHQEVSRPLITSLVTFTAFVLVGSMPLIPLTFFTNIYFWEILILVSVVLFMVGSLRSRLTSITWWRGGLEVMLAGITASFIAYAIGEFLNKLF
jgi:vacuolar iron transporter family protein